MPRNLKINNNIKNKKTVIMSHNPNIFRLDMQKIISEISNYVEEKEQIHEEMQEVKTEEMQEVKTEEMQEVKTEEYENFCRICFEENNYYENRLISPCLCKGTQKFIHTNCLKEWRRVNANNPEKRDNCEICNFKFVIENRDNFIKYKEEMTLYTLFLRHMSIALFSIVYGSIDYSFDFFTVKTLNFFSSNNYEICILLQNMKKRINDGNDSYMLFMYIIFMYSFINFLTYSFLTCRTLLNHIVIKENRFITNTSKFKLYLKLQQPFFLFFYYISLILNDFNFFVCILPFVCFINIFTYNLYVMKTNEILDSLNNIDEEVIYSFEENPLLEIQSIEDNS